jgi:putative membrane protein
MKTNYQKTFTQVIAITTIVIGLSACSDNNQKIKDTKTIAEEHNNAKFENISNENDAQFLVKAAEINLEEIALGKLAQETSKTKQVQELGSMMEKQHRVAMEELQNLASKKTITIPTELTQSGKDACNKINTKTGKEFDKEYCEMMVQGHKGAIEIFEMASTESIDTDIKAWATIMLPILRTHMDHALTCQEKCGK